MRFPTERISYPHERSDGQARHFSGCRQARVRRGRDVPVVEHLSAEAFRGYLADADRILLIAEQDDRVVGYTMLVLGEPHDEDVAAAITLRPTVELSKCYVLPGHHGGGVAGGLMLASIEAARERGVAGIWLGVNQENERAQRFYAKSGFHRVGTKRFRVGEQWGDAYVLEQPLAVTTSVT